MKISFDFSSLSTAHEKLRHVNLTENCSNNVCWQSVAKKSGSQQQVCQIVLIWSRKCEMTKSNRIDCQ